MWRTEILIFFCVDRFKTVFSRDTSCCRNFGLNLRNRTAVLRFLNSLAHCKCVVHMMTLLGSSKLLLKTSSVLHAQIFLVCICNNFEFWSFAILLLSPLKINYDLEIEVS